MSMDNLGHYASQCPHAKKEKGEEEVASGCTSIGREGGVVGFQRQEIIHTIQGVCLTPIFRGHFPIWAISK